MRRPTIAIRLSQAERAEIEAAASRIGVGPTTFLRSAALAVARRQVTPATVELDTGDTLALAGTLNEKAGT